MKEFTWGGRGIGASWREDVKKEFAIHAQEFEGKTKSMPES